VVRSARLWTKESLADVAKVHQEGCSCFTETSLSMLPDLITGLMTTVNFLKRSISASGSRVEVAEIERVD
jgi:hypothetical protein